MNDIYSYPFPSAKIDVDDIAEFIREIFISKFGKEKLIAVEFNTYPNEYSINLIVTKKDEAVSEFISQLREFFIKKGISVLLLASEKEGQLV